MDNHNTTTDDISTDKVLKAYFANRTPPSAKLREQIIAQLYEIESTESETEATKTETGEPAAAQTPSRWIWSVALYDFLMSSAIIYILWIFFGQSLIVYAAAAFVGLSLLAAIVIMLASYKLTMKKRGFAPMCII